MNGIVIKNLADCLGADNRTGIISLKQRHDDAAYYRNTRIKYVTPVSYYIYSLREKRLKAGNRLVRSMYGAALLLARMLSVSQRVISKTGLHDPLARRLGKAVEESLKAEKYEYVVLIGRPFEAFAAALPLAVKYKETRFIGYQADNFVTGEDVHYPEFLLAGRNRERAALMNKCARHFWRYFMTGPVYAKEKRYLQGKNRVKVTGLPLIINQRPAAGSRGGRNRDGAVRLVYAGSLLKGFRPPGDCLDILMKLVEMIKVHIDFYHCGDCDDILDAYSEKSGGAVANRGTVSSERAYEAVNSSDVLAAISNFAGDQVSGKTFDCISAGKPVVFFYYKDGDSNLEFFQKYKLGLCIKMAPQNVQGNAEAVCRFIKENLGRTVSFDEVEKQFWQYTPKCVADEMFQ